MAAKMPENKYRAKKSMKRHVDPVTGKVLYACEVCGQEGLTDDDLRSHMLLVHLEGNNACPFCDLGDISPDEMILHVNSAHLDYLSPQDESLDEDDDDTLMITNGFGDHPVFSSPALRRRNNHRDNNTPPRVPTITIDDNCDNYNANLHKANNSSSNHGSPSRAQLSLNLNQLEARDKRNRGVSNGHGSNHSNNHGLMATNGLSATNGRRSPLIDQSVTQCPLCGLNESTPEKLEEHVNRAHFDLTSPSFPVMSPQEEVVVFTCPLCMKQFESSPDLELHVNIDHKDILSPAKSTIEASSHASKDTKSKDTKLSVAATPVESASPGSESGVCPVCSRGGFNNYKELAHHIDTHFTRKPSIASPEEGGWERRLVTELEKQEKEVQRMREQQEFSLLRAQYGMDNEGNYAQQSLTNMQRAVYAGEMSVADYYERQIELKVAEKNGVDDGRSCTKGLLGSIKAVADGSPTIAAVHCCSHVDHHGSTYGDRGWGCGYRNIQMLLSSLQHHTGYYARLFSGPNLMPSISQIQRLIEQAWRQGFDTQGCEQLGGKLSNSRKWIGATEVVTLFSSFRIRCQLIDCHRPTGPDGTHPELFKWCLDYFSSPADFKPPIYLQHQGHSRTVIGIEQLTGKDGNEGSLRLLVLDPSYSATQVSQLLQTSTAASAMRLIRKSLASMRAKQYQMVVVTGLIASEQDYHQSKVLQSVRLPKD